MEASMHDQVIELAERGKALTTQINGVRSQYCSFNHHFYISGGARTVFELAL